MRRREEGLPLSFFPEFIHSSTRQVYKSLILIFQRIHFSVSLLNTMDFNCCVSHSSFRCVFCLIVTVLFCSLRLGYHVFCEPLSLTCEILRSEVSSSGSRLLCLVCLRSSSPILIAFEVLKFGV